MWCAAKIARAVRCSAVFSALAGCNGPVPAQVPVASTQEVAAYANDRIHVGAERTDQYVPLLLGHRVAVVTNQTGMIGHTHLVDSLLAIGVNVKMVFAPEHGFRGEASAGEHVADERDKRTGLPLVSLYGKNKKPSPAQLADVDILLFDIQDVGVRFYTYTSTLHYVMEAAAEQGKQVIVLDRPNPNGFYVDGPVLDTAFRSFVGMDPVPLVHGMTIGEYARMINGQGWLKGSVKCNLTVIPCSGYDHSTYYELPVKPSPNLPNMAAVYLYPALGLFEGTNVSVGRGTDKPFQCIGFPGCTLGDYSFTPRSMPGAAKPPHEGQRCTGLDLSSYGDFYTRLDPGLTLEWLIGMYNAAPDKAKFFNNFFDKLAGTNTLRKAVEAGIPESEIRKSWRKDLDVFKTMRKGYLLYP
ncbi:MAG: DUF1343 domain-containing protein [Bacteroidetes bacterium]|nr:DUF1343 domain-containing protein [Bacteroidota bacterium]MBS1940162.1 DUF1343 domain-containing protein [Bacteroidota bacterium]